MAEFNDRILHRTDYPVRAKFGRRAVLALASVGPAALWGCYFDKRFQLDWTEEVKLLDGRVVQVRLQHSYERVEPSWTKYGGLSSPRDTTLTFVPRPTRAAVSQEFKGFSPIFLDQDEGVWYCVLNGGYYHGSRSIAGQDWGEADGPYAQWAIKLVDDKWVPISMAQLPEKFQRVNLIPLNASAAEFAHFSGRTISLAEKEHWRSLHPPSHAHLRLERPLQGKR